MKILFLDIETAPNLAYVWDIWQHVNIKGIVKGQSILCFAAKWYGKDQIIFDSVYQSTEKQMLVKVHKLLDQADVVVHFYGSRFDVPRLNTEFLKHGMKPPSPYKQVDLKEVSRKKFGFPSNKLEYISKALGIGEKIKAKDGVTFELWIDCIKGDTDAWKKMKAYNIQDTILLERLYKKYLPWITSHPNSGAYNGKPESCPNCGGTHLHRRGTFVANLRRYFRYQCQDCGTWSRGNVALPKGKVSRRVSVS